jgi:hypothetical protein
MLIKEYRIPLPLTVEEYRIAQLYMIAVSDTCASFRLNSSLKSEIFLTHCRRRAEKRAVVKAAGWRF